MRIVFVITGLGVGGAESMLLKVLEGLDRDQFEPHVVSLTGSGPIAPRIEAMGVPVTVFDLRSPLTLLGAVFRLTWLFRSLRADVVSTWMYHADLIGGIAARLAGKPVVWGVRHSDLSPSGLKGSTRAIMRACAICSGFVPRDIIYCSFSARTEHQGNGYSTSRGVVLPNGFNLELFHPDSEARREVRRELNIPTDACLAGIVGRFHPIKNYRGFLKAARHVSDRLPNARFVMAGQGLESSNDELAGWIADLDLEGRIYLLGPRNDVPRIMSALDVVVLSSHGEAFPNVLGEAMACGIPCVTTDVGDAAQIVGETGVVAPAGDMSGLAEGIVQVLSMMPEARQRLGDAARQRVADNFDVRVVGRLYQDLFAELARSDAVSTILEGDKA